MVFTGGDQGGHDAHRALPRFRRVDQGPHLCPEQGGPRGNSPSLLLSSPELSDTKGRVQCPPGVGP